MPTWIADMALEVSIYADLKESDIEKVMKEFHQIWPRYSERRWQAMLVTAPDQAAFRTKMNAVFRTIRTDPELSPYPDKTGWDLGDPFPVAMDWSWKGATHYEVPTIYVTTQQHGYRPWTIPFDDPANRLAEVCVRLQWREARTV
jgi:hypothetical protein